MKDENEFDETIRNISRLDDLAPGPNALRRASARRAYLEQAGRLRARATVVSSRRWAGLGRSPWRVATASFAALVLAFGTLTGAVYASDRARPGDLLYPIDLQAEKVHLMLTRAPSRAVPVLLAIADERLLETEQLAAANDAAGMEVALAGYVQTISEIEQTVDEADPDHAVLSAEVDAALSLHEQRLLLIRAIAPEQAIQGLDRAIEAERMERRKVAPGNRPGDAPTPKPGQSGSSPDAQDKEPKNPGKEPGSPQNNGTSENPGPPAAHGPPDKPDKPHKPHP